MILARCEDKILVQLEDKSTHQTVQVAIDNFSNRLLATANIDGVMSTFAGPVNVQGGNLAMILDRTPDSRLLLNVGGIRITTDKHALLSTAQVTRVQGASASGTLRWITPRNNRFRTKLAQTSENTLRIEFRGTPVSDVSVEFANGATISFGPHQAIFNIPRGIRRSAQNFHAPAYQENVPRAAVSYAASLIPEDQAFTPRILLYPARDLTQYVEISTRPQCASIYVNDSVFDLEPQLAETALGAVTLVVEDPAYLTRLVVGMRT
jgi:hypothetical protein